MIDAIDRQRMIDVIYPCRNQDTVIDDNEIDLLCKKREDAISISSIQTILTEEGNLEKRCIDPLAMAKLGREQRTHRDRNIGKKAILENEFDLIDRVTF